MLVSCRFRQPTANLGRVAECETHAIRLENVRLTLGRASHWKEDTGAPRYFPIPSYVLLLWVGMLMTYSTFETGSPRYRPDVTREARDTTLNLH